MGCFLPKSKTGWASVTPTNVTQNPLFCLFHHRESRFNKVRTIFYFLCYDISQNWKCKLWTFVNWSGILFWRESHQTDVSGGFYYWLRFAPFWWPPAQFLQGVYTFEWLLDYGMKWQVWHPVLLHECAPMKVPDYPHRLQNSTHIQHFRGLSGKNEVTLLNSLKKHKTVSIFNVSLSSPLKTVLHGWQSLQHFSI